MQEKSFLEQFTGEYEVMGITIVVAFKNEQALSVTVPQQPTYEFVPYKGTEFRFKGLTGYSIEFKRDADGIVTEAAFEQPFGVVTAKKNSAIRRDEQQRDYRSRCCSSLLINLWVTYRLPGSE